MKQQNEIKKDIADLILLFHNFVKSWGDKQYPYRTN